MGVCLFVCVDNSSQKVPNVDPVRLVDKHTSHSYMKLNYCKNQRTVLYLRRFGLLPFSPNLAILHVNIAAKL